MKKIFSYFCIICVLAGYLTFPSAALSTITSSSPPKINYSYTQNTPAGTIRYISQIKSSPYFYSDYWGDNWLYSHNDGVFSGPGSECGTCCISMALSYLGINQTPKNILDSGNGVTYFDGNWGAKYISTDFLSAMENYINGNGKYSPPIIHLKNYSTYGHYVIIYEKKSASTYSVVDPANSSNWTINISGSLATYAGNRDTIGSVVQYYNPNVNVSDNRSIILFDACGGECNTLQMKISFGEKYGTLPTPKRSGYIFDGWYSEKDGKGSKYTADMKYWGKNETVTWYANWKIDGSIINFDPCGGTCSTSFIVRKFGQLYGDLPVPVRDGYIFDGWYSEKNGKGSKYTADMKYWGRNETVTWYANWIQASPDIDRPHSVLFPKPNTYTQGQFSDVPASQWFTENVAAAVEFGLMKGTSSSTFNPYGDVTLAEAITMAARIHSIYTTGDESFVQSADNAWYQVYLDYAYQNGIIDRRYYNADVQQKATRAQYAEIFANALPDETLFAQNDVPDNAIPDVSISAPYAPAVYKLYRAGILAGGDANGTFSPLTYITRAESATIVARMADSENRMSFSL